MSVDRGTFPAAFDANVDRAIKESYLTAPLFLEHVNVIQDGSKSDDFKVDADASLGALREKIENGDIPLDTPSQRYTLALLYVTWALGFEASYEMQSDDKRGKVLRLAGQLGKSANETINILAANLVNLGFTTTWGDSKALFATDHPMEGGGTASNKPATDADLDATTLNAALINLMTTLDHRGKHMPIRGVRLVLPPALDKIGVELAQSANAPHTSDNQLNYFRSRVVFNGSNPYLTDTNAWMVQALEGHGLDLIFREMFNTANYPTLSQLGKVFYGKMRAVAGVEFWRGTYASSGS
jgi:phage major head subunit gpT-like protein